MALADGTKGVPVPQARMKNDAQRFCADMLRRLRARKNFSFKEADGIITLTFPDCSVADFTTPLPKEPSGGGDRR